MKLFYKWGIILYVTACLVSGCTTQKERAKSRKAVYVLCKKGELPTELKKMIDKEKHQVFHFTYSNMEHTYIAAGYGEQPGRGYRIRVRSLREDSQHVYVDTDLIGVEKKHQQRGSSFPYLVIKMKYYEKETVFR